MSGLAMVEQSVSEGKEFLTFILGEEIYGLGIGCVREIIGMQAITPLPDVPAYIEGVINLRGRVIPVLCVRQRMNMPLVERNSRTCIIVVRIQDETVGLIVDTVSEVIRIPDNKIEPAPRMAMGGAHYLAGLGNVDEKVRLLLDVEALLGAPRSAA
ncbi:MAG: chemotaxis protein CheW [Myxococcota bacterium]|nr:chemotaxis protein CheW [Myxococcota bacterium]